MHIISLVTCRTQIGPGVPICKIQIGFSFTRWWIGPGAPICKIQVGFSFTRWWTWWSNFTTFVLLLKSIKGIHQKFEVCLMRWGRDKERDKEGWFCEAAHDGQWSREHVLLYQVAVPLCLRGVLYSAASAAIITHKIKRWWDAFWQYLSTLHVCSNMLWIVRRRKTQRIMQKFKRNHFNNIHWSVRNITCNVNGTRM